MKKIFVFSDGGARGNPGPAAVGVVIKDEKGKSLARLGRFIGKATNNVAEYQAVIEALKWLKDWKEKKTEVIFFLDSQLVVNQLNGVFKIKSGRLKELIIRIKKLEKKMEAKITYRFIPREKNQEADGLVNQTIERFLNTAL